MKLFSMLFCSRSEPSQKEYKNRIQSTDSSLHLSQSISIFLQGNFRQKVKQYQKTHPDQVIRFRKKQQSCHVVRDINHMSDNIKRSLQMVDNKGYLRQICFSLWPKYMSDKLSQIQNSETQDWKKLLLKQIDDLQYVFGNYVESIYKNIVKQPNFHIHLSIAFKDALDRVSASEKWIPISCRIQNFYRLSKYRIQNIMVANKIVEDDFRHEISLVKKIYIEPSFSKKLQHIAELKPLVSAYSRPKLIFSICEYCIYKAGLAGYHEMLQFLQLVKSPDFQMEQFLKLLKAASIRTVLKFQQQDPFKYEYVTFNLSTTDTFVITNLDTIVSTQNNWNSLISLTYMKPFMSINIKLNMKINHFKIGVIGNFDENSQLRDLSQTNESICLCLMSNSLIQKGKRTKIGGIPKNLQEIQLNILEKEIEWKWSGCCVTTKISFKSPIRLHVVMKKGKFKQLPIRKFKIDES